MECPQQKPTLGGHTGRRQDANAVRPGAAWPREHQPRLLAAGLPNAAEATLRLPSRNVNPTDFVLRELVESRHQAFGCPGPHHEGPSRHRLNCGTRWNRRWSVSGWRRCDCLPTFRSSRAPSWA